MTNGEIHKCFFLFSIDFNNTIACLKMHAWRKLNKLPKKREPKVLWKKTSKSDPSLDWLGTFLKPVMFWNSTWNALPYLLDAVLIFHRSALTITPILNSNQLCFWVLKFDLFWVLIKLWQNWIWSKFRMQFQFNQTSKQS